MTLGLNRLKKNKAQCIISLLLAGVVLFIAYYKGPSLFENLKQAKINWILAGLAFYLINYIIRAFRFKTISRQHLKIWPDTVRSVSLHGFATYMLPFRAGDLTLPIILKTISQISPTEGGRILLKARLLDISTLGFWTLLAAIISSINISYSIRAVWFITGVGMCLSPVAVKYLCKLGNKKDAWILRRIATVRHVVQFSRLELLESLGVWAAIGISFYCVVRAVGLPLGVGDVWLLITIQLPLQFIPIQGFANAGNHESGWVAGLMILGVSASEALKFALASHAILLSYVLVIGIFVLFTQRIFKR